ncbi:hypothetical protein PHLCEN_2v5924 [Hermanssonia centrifuga]|uniref:C2H2-type domain-containing protein n=1 Tax=Hermanssonia centrifuga TaxID=98765 RepID=A0A2R6P0X2_9APHY|nr:hypothetical protein PHLCEN_2v5924 [Hermanssonia centrifuga]
MAISLAFQCETCGRRFSVASNLNRHAKRCTTRPESATTARNPSDPQSTAGDKQPAINTPAPADTLAPSQATFTATLQPLLPATRGRKRSAPVGDSDAMPQPSTSNSDHPRRKRQRRAPSPSRWVPESLKNYDLTPYPKSTPVPLPPVQPYGHERSPLWEERNSFDEVSSSTPYHPTGWRGILPGPALLGQEIGTMGGRLLVF